MKIGMRCGRARTLLLPLLGFVAMGEVNAQTLKTLYSFSGVCCIPPGGGNKPLAGPILVGPALYVTTTGPGTVFRINTNGTGFTNLYNFGLDPSSGINPQSRLTFSDNMLYGTTPNPSIVFSYGAVFNLRSDGSAFGYLYVFSGSDGAHPSGPLSVSVNPLDGTTTLYGTTAAGGDFGHGTVFSLTTYGAFTTLHPFLGLDGARPSGLILSGNTLYGMTTVGGSFGGGTIYAITTDGTGFTTLYHFGPATNSNGGGAFTNADGAYPNAGLTLSGNTLFGTTSIGGSAGQGTLFKVGVDGTGFAVLHAFTALVTGTNSDGSTPGGELALSTNTLFGTTFRGGASGNGVVFKVGTDGTSFATLYDFTGGMDGASPNGGLAIAGNVLYGTTSSGGIDGYGTVFSVFDAPVPPPLSISSSGPNVILEWPTGINGFSYAGYTLQSATDLGSPVWQTSLATPVILNGENVVTIPISGTQQFVRLSQ